jgi:hypothetical protein
MGVRLRCGQGTRYENGFQDVDFGQLRPFSLTGLGQGYQQALAVAFEHERLQHIL